MLKGDPCFLSLGRYDIHHKGLDLLLRGFAAAIRSNAVPRTAAVNMVGRGSEGADQLKKIASEEGIADHLNIVGEVSDEGRADVLRECDVMLLTSRFDGFGLVALEAMLAGKPVVVSRQAGISSWIDRARSGILAEPSVAGVRDALSQCMMVKKRWPLMGSNGRSYAHRYMSWDQVAARAAHAYTELLQLTQCPTESREGMHIIDIDSQTSECGEISECL
jgi:glycosyltransferase involved in cell wall biosynthesis